jgi:hypothetical protein
MNHRGTEAQRPKFGFPLRFRVEQTGSVLYAGEFVYGVLCGIAKVQEGLTAQEAEVLAEALNKSLDGFRDWRGIGPKVVLQLGLEFSTKAEM